MCRCGAWPTTTVPSAATAGWRHGPHEAAGPGPARPGGVPDPALKKPPRCARRCGGWPSQSREDCTGRAPRVRRFTAGSDPGAYHRGFLESRPARERDDPTDGLLATSDGLPLRESHGRDGARQQQGKAHSSGLHSGLEPATLSRTRRKRRTTNRERRPTPGTWSVAALARRNAGGHARLGSARSQHVGHTRRQVSLANLSPACGADHQP